MYIFLMNGLNVTYAAAKRTATIKITFYHPTTSADATAVKSVLSKQDAKCTFNIHT